MKRHAVITGGGSGIGLAIAGELKACGCDVTIMGRSPERLAAAAAALDGARAITCDVTEPQNVASAFATAAAAAGPVSILVNNAGVVRTAPFSRQTDADWEMLWRTNVMGAVHAIREVLPAMRDLPGARIVNVASTASLKGYGYVSAYVATKHALLGLTRALALELVRTGVTVNAVCPGYADTDIIRDAVDAIVQKTGRTEDEARATFTGANPQGRLIDPAEVAAAVRWLVGEGARSVTGQAIAIAGGEVM
ncbi:MAG TPA: SDR family oxidoreductase [Caulobacteraceae bacterium]|nr:SDR family oxidoreductase [Caulobacteraceae bacterium]